MGSQKLNNSATFHTVVLCLAVTLFAFGLAAHFAKAFLIYKTSGDHTLLGMFFIASVFAAAVFWKMNKDLKRHYALTATVRSKE